MTKAILQQKELLTTALTHLDAIERRENLYKAATIPSLKVSYKSLLQISQIQYAETMAALHLVISEFAHSDTTESDADLLKNVDEFMQQLTINADANGLLEKPKEDLFKTMGDLLDPTATVNAMHNIFSGQINRATKMAQSNHEDFFGENR